MSEKPPQSTSALLQLCQKQDSVLIFALDDAGQPIVELNLSPDEAVYLGHGLVRAAHRLRPSWKTAGSETQ